MKTRVMVAQGQALFVRVWTTNDRWLRLRGTVNYHMEMVGFSLIFSELEEDNINSLTALIDELGQQSS